MAAKKTTEKIHTEDVLCDMFIRMMEKGIVPWNKPWFGREEVVYNLFSPKDKWYSGVNQMILPFIGGYMTRKQMEEHNIKVKPGEQSFPLFYKQAKDVINEIEMPDGTIKYVKDTKFIFRYYQVWHTSQTDISEELLAKYERKIDEAVITTELSEKVKEVDDVLHKYMLREGIAYHEDGAIACYRNSDEIFMPPMHTFISDVSYVDTKAHECTHSTGAEKRLNRNMSGTKGSSNYAKEELVAEMGAAIMLHSFGINTDDTDKNNAAYLQSWMNKIKDCKAHLYNAALQARKAVKLMLGENNIVQSQIAI